MNTNEEKYYDNCFTEIEEGKVNAEFNKATLTCFDSKNNKFSMDCEGNLVVNSIITRELSPTTGLTIDDIYPVGSIYMSVANANPANLFGGTWEQIKGRFLLGCGENDSNSNDFYGTYNAGTCNFAADEKGGEPFHLLTIDEIPQHNHPLIKNVPYGMPYNDTAGIDAGSGGIVHYKESYEPFKVGYTGSSFGHNNMPPYLTVYMWKRTA